MDQLADYNSSSDESEEDVHMNPIVTSKVKVRKIIGLNAILPREIADRLVRSTVQGSDDDSSDDELELNKLSGRPIGKETDRRSSAVAVDSGLQQLLTDLHSLAPNQATVTNNARPVIQLATKQRQLFGSDDVIEVTASSHMNPTCNHLEPQMPYFRRAMNAAPAILEPIEIPTGHLSEINAPGQEMDQPTTAVRLQEPEAQGRKELLHNLRRGNFSSIDHHREVLNLQQSISEYRPTEDLLSVTQEQHRGSSMNRVSLSGLQTYAPTEGTTVQSTLSSKQRSKHQIHSLVVNAAVLQAKRNQEASFINKGTVTRKDGKRKYGW